MTHSTEDRDQAIRDAFDSWGTAWNRGDLAGYLAGYWDSNQTRYVSNGRVIQGKTAIVETFKSLYTSPAMLGTFSVIHLELKYLSDHDALLFGLFEHTLGDISREGAFTVHVRNFEGEWLIVSDHTSTRG